MGRILVTGSTDGIGRARAADLLAAGHDVVVHAHPAVHDEDLQERLLVALADATGVVLER